MSAWLGTALLKGSDPWKKKASIQSPGQQLWGVIKNSNWTPGRGWPATGMCCGSGKKASKDEQIWGREERTENVNIDHWRKRGDVSSGGDEEHKDGKRHREPAWKRKTIHQMHRINVSLRVKDAVWHSYMRMIKSGKKDDWKWRKLITEHVWWTDGGELCI